MRLRDERGMMAIGVALMLIVVLALFGGALWQYSMFELRRVEQAEQDMQALFLARAGAEAVMGAWRMDFDPEKQRPLGQMDTLYYDTEHDRLTVVKPSSYLGSVDVAVRLEDLSGEGDLVTVIESTAKVGSVTRTVRLTTYPYRYGHDKKLGWYLEGDGRIQEPKGQAKEPVIMRAKSGDAPIYADSETLEEYGSLAFAASDLIFESSLQLLRDPYLGLWLDPAFTLRLEAERIFFRGLQVAYLDTYLVDPKSYTVVLQLPTGPEGMGEPGEEVQGKVAGGNVIPDARYGQVYFDAGKGDYLLKVARSLSSKWDRTVDLKLEGKAFFFRDGWKLDPERIIEEGVDEYFRKAMADGDLLPILPQYQTNREALKSLRPFFWER